MDQQTDKRLVAMKPRNDVGECRGQVDGLKVRGHRRRHHVIASFLVDWRIALASGVPQRFPQGLYWAAVVFGTVGFVRVERRGVPR